MAAIFRCNYRNFREEYSRVKVSLLDNVIYRL